MVLIVAILIGMLFPNVVIVADGRSELKIKFDFDVQNQDDVWVALCWNELEKNEALTNGLSGEVPFHPLLFAEDRIGEIDFPHSSKYNGDAELSYHEPEFVVIQMGQNGSGESLVFEMPQGRGARTLDANPQYAIVNEALHEVRD